MSRYLGEPDFKHGTPPTLGVLITNLGTPDAPTSKALRRYLGEFLWDPRVVETPRPIWWAALHGIILRTRPRRSAAAYARVWGEDGSPLLVISERQRDALQRALEQRMAGPVKVALAMRYGTPSIAEGLAGLRAANVRRLLVLPLYPQYAAATTASTFDAVTSELQRWRWLPELRFVNHYHDDPGYIDALAAQVRTTWEAYGRGERLLMSFHGIPQAYFEAGDPYHCECHKTARLLAEHLGLEEEQWQLAFQSRFGPRQWLKPYTDHTLKDWAKKGVKKVDVISPAFAADCLETLEEIAQENRDLFLQAGGESFRYIPALNDTPEHIDALAGLVQRHTGGWPESAAQRDMNSVDQALRDSQHRAQSMGAEQ